MNRYGQLILVCLLGACQGASTPVIQYQFCLDVAHETGEIKARLIELARRNKMQFTDRSIEAESESRTLDQGNGRLSQSYPFIMMSVSRATGPSLTVTNAGLPANQMVVGVSGGNKKDAIQLATLAQSDLSKRWSLVVVPPGTGAHPMSCP